MAYTQDNRIGRLHTPLGKDKLLIRRMTAVERLSEPFTIVVDAVSEAPVALHDLLGVPVWVEFKADHRAGFNRFFSGHVWEYVELHDDNEGFHCRLTLRPLVQFQSLNRRNRIFQNKTVKDIANTIIAGEKKLQLNGSYSAYEYCVQYQESDFDFVSRLMEHEGIYYYFSHAEGQHSIVVVDERNAHATGVPAEVELVPGHARRDVACITAISERRGLGPMKVTVDDYDFEAPTTELKQSKEPAMKMGKGADRWRSASGRPPAWASEAEIYDFPSKYNSKQSADATRKMTAWLDANRRQMARSFAEGTCFAAAVGRKITIQFHDKKTSAAYLIVGTTHRYSSPPYGSNNDSDEDMSVELELMPATEQYRPALRTPRPRVLGPQTALVVGPAGEEIHTDKYGRIKVQFHWDREGQKDDNSSCFVRVAHAVAGKRWGVFNLPRMGQEVVVEFLDGDPDRPLVIGSVYNADNMPPVGLPDNKTQFGFKSYITKGGGGYNHWWVEDKKGEEVVWFRAERDYKALIVHADEEREYTEGNRKTTFKKGNDELIITEGKRDQTIQQDDTKTIKQGSITTTIEQGDETRTIKQGKRTTTIQQDETLTVKMGNRSAEIDMGNEALTVKMGNVDIKVNLGSHKTEAMQSIELKCGGSSLKLDPMQIEMKAMMVKIEGSIMLQTKGLMVQQEASAIHIVKGGLVMIN